MCLLLCFLFNVVACKCDPGGSVNMNCFKHSGDCSCVTGVRGKKCDRYRWDLFRSCLSILYPSIYNFLRCGGGGVGGWRRIMGCSSLDYSLSTIIKNKKKNVHFPSFWLEHFRHSFRVIDLQPPDLFSLLFSIKNLIARYKGVTISRPNAMYVCICLPGLFHWFLLHGDVHS